MNEPKKDCANSSKTKPCTSPPAPGHIYCHPCRVANGGYPLARKK